ncbi:hypothetical protein NX059_009568 [Plenodomus lindquistii]|nr:hypothetical protein NX059_009568 [Plenodomus lindquistii]
MSGIDDVYTYTVFRSSQKPNSCPFAEMHLHPHVLLNDMAKPSCHLCKQNLDDKMYPTLGPFDLWGYTSYGRDDQCLRAEAGVCSKKTGPWSHSSSIRWC